LALVASCFGALSDPTRLKILRALKDGDKTVHELVRLFEWTQPNISRHLSILAQAGLVKKTKEGMYVRYAASSPQIFLICENVCGHVRGTLESLQGLEAPPKAKRKQQGQRKRPLKGRRETRA
jgi:DNA-binding transcriptional ArsR family regulator